MPEGQQRQQGYDPSNSTPYQAYQPPEMAPPMPSPAQPQNPGFQFSGAPISKLGAVAGVLDNVLRGYMNGKAQSEAKKAFQIKAKSDNLRASYEQDAQRLYDMSKVGTDPNSEEYKKAKMAVDGSWGALQDWIGSHINGQDGGKKKSKGKGKDANIPPAAVLANPASTPQEKSEAIFKLSQKLGAPVLGQVAQFYTPQAQQQRKNQGMATDLETGDLQHQKAIQDAQSVMDAYNKVPQSQWTEPMKQHYENQKRIVDDAQERRTGTPKLYKRADGTQAMLFPSQVREDDEPVTKPSESDLKRADYDKAVKGGYKGSFESWTAEQSAAGRRAGAPPIARGSGGGAGGKIDARFNQWVGYFKKQGLDQAHAEAKARVKVEGAASVTADAIAKEYSEDPYGFDSDVLKRAMNEVIQDPTNGYWDTEKKEPKPWVKDAFANVLGYNDDENTYQYRKPQDWKVLQPDSKGKYSGDVTKEQVQKIDSQLQQKIQAILLKQKGLTPDEVSEAKERMLSVFGYIPTNTGTPSESPQTAGTPAPPASSPGGAGGKEKFPNGKQRKSVFLKDNPGATSADWDSIKPQLKQQGIEPVDD